MDWSNERYVRLYTRDTVTWKLLDWHARAVLMFMIRKVDRAGVIDVGADGARGLAALLELPLDVVAPALEQLSRGDEPTVVWTGSAFVLPRFLDAQEAAQSDGQRQRELRARRRDIAMTVTIRDAAERGLIGSDQKRLAGHEPRALGPGDPVTDPSRIVTAGHETNHDRHAESQRVTPSLASIRIGSAGSESPLVSIEQEIKSVRQKRTRGPLGATPAELASVRVVLAKLSAESGVAYRGSDAHTALITRQLRAGVTELELRAVVAYCGDRWKDDPKMREYLRPETLFGPQSIAKYLDPARTKYAELLARAERQPSLEVVR